VTPRELALGFGTWALFGLAAAGCGGAPSTSTSTSTSTGAGGETGAGGANSGGDSSGGATTGTTTDAPPFELDVHTALSPEKSLVLTTNLPALVADCKALPFKDTPCADLDEDGLADAWEGVVLDRLRPLQRLDEQESLVTDATAVMGNIGRVALVTPSPLRVRMFFVLAYSKDYGSCGFTGHDGDPERVALDLAAPESGGPGDVTALAFYTAAHEYTSGDHSMKFQGADLTKLTFEKDAVTSEPRWIVFPSADKHATYASLDICENISAVPCVDEDCGPDGVANPKDFDRLPAFVNAGEEAHPLVTDLAAIGFPGEDAWAKKAFCGGLGGATCSAQVRDKLLIDPFVP
jgi:hypothetical protein